MSAGTGIYHSEANNSSTEVLRALQIWILLDFRNHVPNYGEYRFEWPDRKNKFLHMVSSKSGDSTNKDESRHKYIHYIFRKRIEVRIPSY